jgi:hypothetical protein
MLPSPSDKKIGVLDWVFEAQYPARECLCLRFSPNLTIRTARLKVRMACYSFPAGLFHSLQHAGLSRRTDCPLLLRLERNRVKQNDRKQYGCHDLKQAMWTREQRQAELTIQHIQRSAPRSGARRFSRE